MAQSGPEPARGRERDFILLSEFAEIRHGPQPIVSENRLIMNPLSTLKQCTIPERGEGSFDTSSFSVRIFSTDFQQGQSEYETISLVFIILFIDFNQIGNSLYLPTLKCYSPKLAMGSLLT